MNLIQWCETYQRRMSRALGTDTPLVLKGRAKRKDRTMFTLTRSLRAYAEENLGVDEDASGSTVTKAVGRAIKAGTLSQDELDDLTFDKSAGVRRKTKSVRSKGASIYRVKDAAEKYSTRRHTGKHFKTGERVVYNGKPVETPSQLDYAKAATWLRMLARKAGIVMPQSDHERAMAVEMFDKESFIYTPSDREAQTISGRKAQDLFNDSVSGGLYLNPVWYDTSIISFPLLYGDLVPYVDLVDMPRGTTVNTAAVSNPTATWMTSEAVGMTAFDATSLVSQITATVTPVSIAIKWGLDLSADALVNIGETLMGLLGMRLAAELDNVIALGNGTTQPLGIFNASGTVTVNSDNSTGGSPTIGDYEALYFGIPKQYRTLPSLNIAYVGNDVSYRRGRNIPVGPGDERRVLGLNEADYAILGTPYRVSANVANVDVACLPLKKYRLWRRLGQEMTFTREGQTLVLANEALLVMRGRYAGRVVDPNAVVICSDFQN